MAMWTWFGLKQGSATTAWPRTGGDDGQAGVLGMPRFDPLHCQSGCRECAEICPTGALTAASAGAEPPIQIDYGRCVVCQLCTEVCPTDALQTSGDWMFAVRQRDDLRWQRAIDAPAGQRLKQCLGALRRSLHIRHVDAGSCNGCESELQALNNPFYNLHRLGIFFTPSPRFADLLLVTGSVTVPMREPLLNTYEAMPEPRLVMANGTCAVSGGIAGGGYNTGHGLDEWLPVDLYLPGCPPSPAAIIEGLLILLERLPQRVKGGQLEC
ncbi:MAG TPA: 4Fe-4S dicluster domain-containing protein [Candidatus Fraserbacteria bacterium]|nr:4Fe-4S dicluster domain-containing protein [Candidatus Fraserbacteria bacterium]